jgi:hypothetical protein
MHQTISGVTHKIEIFDKSNVDVFLKKEKSTFDLYNKSRNCIYQNKKIINNSSLNYLNDLDGNDLFSPSYQLKSILKKEFDDCEKLYPFLGEVYINLFFDKEVLKNKKFNFLSKENYNIFLNSSLDKNAINIVDWIINNSSTDRIIDIIESQTENIVIKKEDSIFLKIQYDTDFLGNKNSLEIKNYRFAIIDGYIESISEIHHMLHFAAKSKEPYVLFCFGMSEEVKNVIIQNNTKRITQIFPVSMTVNENTINILNDIALLHNSDIISSFKGQTISQEMRKELKIGNNITFKRNGFKIEPLCSKSTIKNHIKFLKERINNSPPESNTQLIANRIENLNTKILKVFVPKDLKESVLFNRELDYLLRMLDSSKKCYYQIEFDGRNLMMPVNLYKIVLNKVNITKNIIYNIDKILIRKE